jgi:RNA binding exosome subunit
MSVHNVSWRINCSAIDDDAVVDAAFAWLVGVDTKVRVEHEKSWHGATQRLLTCRFERRKASTTALARLGEPLLTKLSENQQWLESRIDEDRVLHIRLDLAKLTMGEMVLTGPNTSRLSIKGQIKLEVYPNQDSIEIAQAVLRKAAKEAAVNGWIGVHPERLGI